LTGVSAACFNDAFCESFARWARRVVDVYTGS
jgi:hypothetical protein